MTETSAAELARTDEGRACLEALLADPATALVAFDFDGTLSPIVADPASAVADPEAVAALGRLGHLVGTVAVITGRPARTAVELGGLDRVAGLEGMVVLGQYGIERWDAETGEFRIPPPPAEIDDVEAALPALLAELGLTGVQLEHKQRAIGLHTRRCADPAGAFRTLAEPVRQLAEQHGLGVEPGRNVLEIRPPGVDKGDALRALVEERGSRSVVFGGDDLGDLPAFHTARALREEGLTSLLVVSASAEEDALVQLADVVVDGPPGVAGWCSAVADLLEGRPA
ncbi:trehalose-phosphatase [Auraticoccus sp. F435]|uniref:Trehalose 6-phosphate phosphatase n=1 Tax=Auraticoccus cholistanensis TaxID=2656650 RepID=A0A6A9V1M6_9ACTN|nr:trehalose-phosphatase [Auraticoccus cholistanensis]MVA77489.1 trehalose-phosphatase [Auraticoccus cholistanensis]